MVDRAAGADNIRLRCIQDECPFSWWKKSRDTSRGRRFSQVMKTEDPLLAAWEATLARSRR